jgi:hypothetical protein
MSSYYILIYLLFTSLVIYYQLFIYETKLFIYLFESFTLLLTVSILR